jgi:hypothetical protein
VPQFPIIQARNNLERQIKTNEERYADYLADAAATELQQVHNEMKLHLEELKTELRNNPATNALERALPQASTVFAKVGSGLAWVGNGLAHGFKLLRDLVAPLGRQGIQAAKTLADKAGLPWLSAIVGMADGGERRPNPSMDQLISLLASVDITLDVTAHDGENADTVAGINRQIATLNTLMGVGATPQNPDSARQFLLKVKMLLPVAPRTSLGNVLNAARVIREGADLHSRLVRAPRSAQALASFNTYYTTKSDPLRAAMLADLQSDPLLANYTVVETVAKVITVTPKP